MSQLVYASRLLPNRSISGFIWLVSSFLPLTEPEIKQIVNLQIGHVQQMLASNGVTLKLTDKALNFLANTGYDPEFGARPVKRAIQHYLLNDLSKKLLAQAVDRNRPITVDVSSAADGLTFCN